LFLVFWDMGLDGEMCMYKSHLVSETLSDTSDCVSNKTLESSYCTSLLVTSLPHLNSDVKSLQFWCLYFAHIDYSDVNWKVIQSLCDLTLWSSNSDIRVIDMSKV
jgi:hypothetical protein